MHRKIREVANFLTAFSIIGFVAFMSLRNPAGGGTAAGLNPYMLHFLAYFAVAGSLMLHFHETRKGRLEAILLAGTIGLGLEVAQIHVGRTSSLLDAFNNLAGASVVLLEPKIGAVEKIVQLEDKTLKKMMPFDEEIP